MSEISGIRQDIRYPAPTGYPVSGFQNGRISGKTAIRSIPTLNTIGSSDLRLIWKFKTPPLMKFLCRGQRVTGAPR